MLLVLKLIADKFVKVSLYFHPPITTNNSRKMIIPTTEPTEILFIRNYDDFNNFAYNCGVIYFNFFKFRKLKIKKKIENIIKYMCSNKKLLYISGTELIQNICLPKYTEIPQCYNFIQPTGKFTQKHIQEVG